MKPLKSVFLVSVGSCALFAACTAPEVARVSANYPFVAGTTADAASAADTTLSDSAVSGADATQESDVTAPDAGPAVPDTGAPDASTAAMDIGAPDAGPAAPDAGAPDASTVAMDIGASDAGPAATDTETSDASAAVVDGDVAPGGCETLYRGARIAGAGDAPTDVCVTGGLFTAIGPAGTLVGAVVKDVTDRWLAPAVIDSHVHLVYYPAAEALAAGGVIAGIDQAAPPSFFSTDFAPMTVLGSGPMITATLGYPTQGWGSDGYGLEVPVGDVPAAIAAVDTVVSLGAALIKVPLEQGPKLTDEQLVAVVTRAHALGRKVSVHALSEETAEKAALIGADILAHTPVEPLSDATVAAWGSRAVVSTLSAFGGAAVTQLARLRTAGARVLYGTDFGNTTALGPSALEISRLTQAGLDGAAILEAMTSAPADYWGLSDLGTIGPGKRAAFLVLAQDPVLEPAVLANPAEVVLP